MMPAYNAAAFIGTAIESILAQTYPRWELVVVDDGSTDGTAAAARQFDNPRIRVVLQANQGEAAARNHALRLVQGEFLAFLDADDLFLPDHLQATVAYLQAHPMRGGVYTDGYYINTLGQRMEPLSSQRRGPFEGHIFEALVRASDVFGPPICTVLRRAEVARRGLTFDTDIVIGPDWDFLTRFAEEAEFGYLGQPTVEYRVHATNITRTAGSERRRLSLIRCREKAIKLPGFAACSRETRWYAFYDLLVNLLPGRPERQVAVLSWPEFKSLAPEDRALLLRLAASQAVLQGDRAAPVGEWFQAALVLNPGDRRARLVAGLHRLSPALCKLLLQARTGAGGRPKAASPFGVLR